MSYENEIIGLNETNLFHFNDTMGEIYYCSSNCSDTSLRPVIPVYDRQAFRISSFLHRQVTKASRPASKLPYFHLS